MARAARIGLVGLGTVGSALAKRLLSGEHDELRLVRVCERTSRQRPAWIGADVEWTCHFDDLLAPDVDILVELVGGVTPPREWLARALLAGKSVVTANKQLVAEEGEPLLALADRQGQAFRYGASVAGGVPVIDAIREGLSGDRLTSVAGVLNGTCNYILTRIEASGAAFEEALREAQEQGYAEADPTADVEGLDARAKLAILCRVAFGIGIPPAGIRCASIGGVTPAAFAEARGRGQTIRQVSRAVRNGPDGRRVEASVGPELVPLDSPLARVTGCENAVIVTGEHGGDTLYAGRGAGGDATAVAVLSDILAIAAGCGVRTPARITESQQ